MSNSSETLPDMLPSVLETLVPGFSLFARIMSLYFRIDISTFSHYLLILAFVWAFSGFAIPRLLGYSQQLVLSFAASVEIKFESTLHEPLIRWASEHDQLRRSRRTIVVTKSIFTPPWQDDETEEGDQDEDPVKEQQKFEKDKDAYWKIQKEKRRLQQISYAPGQGLFHVFTFRGCLVGFRRDPHPSAHNIWLADAETITLLAWRQQTLLDLLEEVQEASLKRKCKRVAIYRGLKQQGMVSWGLNSSKPPRSLQTLSLSQQIRTALVRDLENFLSPRSRIWYQACGIPHRRGYLFYAPPGTGKSSMSFVLASLFCLDIYTISLGSSNLDEDGLSKLFYELPSRCIVLLEDIDRAGIRKQPQREIKSDGGPLPGEDTNYTGISLSALLNLIDGVAAHEGRVLIMTTNHLDKLDAALIRPGRADKKFFFGHADRKCIEHMFSSFYTATTSIRQASSTEPQLDQLSSTRIRTLSVSFAHQVPAGQFTPAAIQNYLMDFKDDPDMALRNTSEWVKDKEASFEEAQYEFPV